MFLKFNYMVFIKARELNFGAVIHENHQRGHEIMQINPGAVNDWIKNRLNFGQLVAPCLCLKEVATFK